MLLDQVTSALCRIIASGPPKSTIETRGHTRVFAHDNPRSADGWHSSCASAMGHMEMLVFGQLFGDFDRFPPTSGSGWRQHSDG